MEKAFAYAYIWHRHPYAGVIVEIRGVRYLLPDTSMDSLGIFKLSCQIDARPNSVPYGFHTEYQNEYGSDSLDHLDGVVKLFKKARKRYEKALDAVGLLNSDFPKYVRLWLKAFGVDECFIETEFPPRTCVVTDLLNLNPDTNNFEAVIHDMCRLAKPVSYPGVKA